MTSAIDLRCGDWRDVLADVDEVDAVITDPPYGARTHAGQRHGRRTGHGADWSSARGLGYAQWTPEDVGAFVAGWAPRCRQWFLACTSHDLLAPYQAALERDGFYVFKPLPVVMKGMNVRLAGDGPSSWSVSLVVARRRTVSSWGTLPGAYVGNPFDAGQNTASATRRTSVIGSKPLWLMRAIVGDYTNPGDVVVDPCAGGGTTLIAAAELGCTAIGAELDPETYAKAQKRIAKGYTPLPHPRASRIKGKPKQGALW